MVSLILPLLRVTCFFFCSGMLDRGRVIKNGMKMELAVRRGELMNWLRNRISSINGQGSQNWRSLSRGIRRAGKGNCLILARFWMMCTRAIPGFTVVEAVYVITRENGFCVKTPV